MWVSPGDAICCGCVHPGVYRCAVYMQMCHFGCRCSYTYVCVQMCKCVCVYACVHVTFRWYSGYGVVAHYNHSCEFSIGVVESHLLTPSEFT